MINVRELRSTQDIDAVVAVSRVHQIECAPKLSYNEDMVRAYCKSTAADPARFAFNIWVAYQDDKAVGYAVASCSPQFHCDTISAELKLVYVLPEHRGGWAFIRMVKVYEQWAKDNAASRIIVGVERTEADKAEKIAELFPKMGYRWAGAVYLKELL